MRFSLSDWLRLILACIAASASMAIVSGASFTALGVPDTTPILLHGAAERAARSLHILAVAYLMLGVLHIPLNALAAWPLLRSCVNGLRFTPWLTETGLGALLGAIVSFPAMVLLLLVPGSGLADSVGASTVGWHPTVAAGIAALLPPGLLLQRLGGVRAWPSLIVVAAAMVAMAAVWRWGLVHEMVPRGLAVAIGLPPLLPMPWWLVMMGLSIGMDILISGILTGLVLGAGLFIMARRPAQPALTG